MDNRERALREANDLLAQQRIRNVLKEAIEELQYVQDARSGCGSDCCATSKGKEIIERGNKALGEARAAIEGEPERKFPIQKATPIPWSLAERAYRTYAEAYGTSQSLERLAQRGGFGWNEFLHLYYGDTHYRRKDELQARWDADELAQAKLRIAELEGRAERVLEAAPGEPAVTREGALRMLDGKFGLTNGGKLVKASSGEEIPEWEPLHIMRARDRLSLPLLRQYREISVNDGCNEYHLSMVDAQIARFEKFEREHPEWMKQPGITKGAVFTPAAQGASEKGRSAQPDWRAILVSIVGGTVPFEGGRDGDQCLWCHWDRDRKIDSWQASQKPEFHAEDCEFARAIAALEGQ